MKENLMRQPLHRQIAETLIKEITTSGKAGQRLESQNELAKRFHVSVLTVREALSALVEEGLIERRRGNGTFITNPECTRHAAVLIEMDISHPRTSFFFLRVTQQLRLEMQNRGRRVRLYAGHQPPYEPWQGQLSCPEFLEDLEQNRICGVAAVGTDSGAPWLEAVRARGVPVVGNDPGFAYRVGTDPRKLVRLGVDYLVAQGRRRLAFLGWGQREAFVEAVDAHGLAPQEEWIQCGMHPALEGAGWAKLKELWSARREQPDALLIGDDLLFSDACSAILELGIRVPEQLLVVTHANRGKAYPCSFPVAKIESDPDAHAQAMAAILVDLMAQRAPSASRAELPFRLVLEDMSRTDAASLPTVPSGDAR